MGEEVNMETCKEYGDPYCDCEGVVAYREFAGGDYCSAHMGALAAAVALGVGRFAPQPVGSSPRRAMRRLIRSFR